MRRVTTLIAFSMLLAALAGCSGLIVTGDERGGTLAGKVAARSLLGVMTVGMSEVPYACVRGELSALPESERALHRHELWETCQQRLAQGTAATQRAPLWQRPVWQDLVWQDLERQRRAEKQRLFLQQQQYLRQQQQLYQQRLYQQRQYPGWRR